MEKDFFELYARHALLAVEIGHNSIAGWNIMVYDRKGKNLCDCKPVVEENAIRREAAFAQAYVKLMEYFNEQLGGY